jgi:hypothetical protein
MKDVDTVNTAVKQARKEERGKNESEIRTAVRSLNGSQKHMIITNCFSK